MEKQIEEILSGGYKSPIEIITGQMRTEFDDGIYKAVQDYGVNVDKEELIRALQYDRGQYEKGYADGLRHRETEWISVEERLPKEYTRVIGCVTEKVSIPVSGECYRVGNRFHFSTLGYNRPISYWMPLPEPPKGE